MKERPTLGNCEGYTKHIIGMTMDEEPYLDIRKALYELLKMIRSTRAFAVEQEAWLQGRRSRLPMSTTER